MGRSVGWSGVGHNVGLRGVVWSNAAKILNRFRRHCRRLHGRPSRPLGASSPLQQALGAWLEPMGPQLPLLLLPGEAAALPLQAQEAPPSLQLLPAMVRSDCCRRQRLLPRAPACRWPRAAAAERPVVQEQRGGRSWHMMLWGQRLPAAVGTGLGCRRWTGAAGHPRPPGPHPRCAADHMRLPGRRSCHPIMIGSLRWERQRLQLGLLLPLLPLPPAAGAAPPALTAPAGAAAAVPPPPLPAAADVARPPRAAAAAAPPLAQPADAAALPAGDRGAAAQPQTAAALLPALPVPSHPPQPPAAAAAPRAACCGSRPAVQSREGLQAGAVR